MNNEDCCEQNYGIRKKRGPKIFLILKNLKDFDMLQIALSRYAATAIGKNA